MKKIVTIIAVSVIGCSMALAQPEGGQWGGQRSGNGPQGDSNANLDSDLPEYSPRVNYLKIDDIDALAQQRTDEVKNIVGLDDKEYKKVLAWMKKDIKFRKKVQKLETPSDDKSEEGEEEGAPEGGPEGGMGGPGGGMGGPGGGMGGPGGGMGGPGGGGPGMGGGPMMGGSSNSLVVVDQYYIEDTEKQLKKILKDDKYNTYRAARPVEMPYSTRSNSGWGGGMMGGPMGGPGGPM